MAFEASGNCIMGRSPRPSCQQNAARPPLPSGEGAPTLARGVDNPSKLFTPPPAIKSAEMIKFPALDGLRGWLAWIVVLDHLVFFSGFGLPWVSREAAQVAGTAAVMIFVILSGFVITHLLLEKREPYGLYLARRALRIFPVYLLALLAGVGTTFLTFRAFLTPDGAPDPVALASLAYPELDVLRYDWAALHSGAYFAHLALHLALLHGVVSQNVLPHAQLMFLSPAWSLSLEWQFYLVAPFVVRAAARKGVSIALVLAALVLFVLSNLNLFGSWGMPSFLPSASLYFAVGIASRLLVTGQPFRFSAWHAASLVLLVAGFLLVDAWRLPVEIWAVFFAVSRYQDRGGPLAGAAGRVFQALFESRLARHLGNASYSTYLVHVPLLQLAMFVAVRVLALAPATATLFIAVTTVASTWGVSQLAYRHVELPFIARGKQLRGGEPAR